MNKVDQMLLLVSVSGTAWLNHLKGIGLATVKKARAAGYVTSELTRPGSFGSRRPPDHRITLMEAGKARCAELQADRDRVAAQIAADRAAARGPCGLCGAVAQQGPYKSWRCSNQDCVGSQTDVPAQYWEAISQAVQELESRLEWAMDHGHNCECRECRVP